MKLIVGLGNPGNKYAKTRHNMGFMAVDLLADIWRIDVDKEDFKGVYGRGKILNEDVILFKPQTFMNLSGEAVILIVNYFRIPLEDIIVIFDDMALNPGKIRLRDSGSSGGQKGIQNIIDLLHTEDIHRIRVGIGEPPQKDAVNYVLGRPDAEDTVKIQLALDNVAAAIRETIEHDFHHAMSKFN